MLNVINFPFDRMAIVRQPNDMAFNIDPLANHKFAAIMKSYFKDVDTGVQYILAAFYELFSNTFTELKGRFSANELRGMLQVMNHVVLVPQCAGSILVDEIQDSIKLEGLDQVLGFNGVQLLRKLKEQSHFDLMALEIWAHGFWYGSERPEVQSEQCLQRHLSLLV